jgi:D-glucosaminate-6-phosphate ammonia-lyase
MSKNDYYSKLGITPVINAVGNQTIFGGSTPTGVVKDAMESSESNYIVMEELFEKTGEYISKLLGTEAGYVTSGAAAAITLSVAGCMAGTDPEKIATLPRTNGMKNEILLQKPQRYTYDRCFELSGAKLIEVGSSELCTETELQNAINENTVAIAYYVQPDDWNDKAVSLKKTLEIAHNNNIPVIADAASQIYPIDYMLETAQSADLVCFGAKYFGAPHSSGLVVGKKEYIDKVKAQSFIAYQLEGRNAMGRPMKLDRQEVIGATVALEQWVNMNHEDRINEYVTKQEIIKNMIGSVNGITAEIVEIPTFHAYSLKVSVDPSVISVDKLVDELANGSPRIMVAPPEDPNAHLKKSDITASGYGTQSDSHPHFMIGVTELNDDQVKQIGDRIKEILS